MTLLIAALLALGVAYRATDARERERFFRFLRQVAHDAALAANARYQRVAPFHALLRERTPLAPVTPSLVLFNTAMFLVLFVAATILGDPDAVIAWGGNYGPRTANGEWWRLITTLFLHSNLLHLMVNFVGLIPAAFVLERLVGPTAFAAVYLIAGVFAGLFSLSVSPIAVNAGASGSVAGIYGLLLATALWRVNRRSTLTIPPVAVKYLLVSAALFVAYAVAAGRTGGTTVGFGTGLLLGLVVAKGVNEGRAPAMRVATATAIMLAAAVSTAVPLRGITDARPEIAAIVAFEQRTSSAFRQALEEFTGGRMSAGALAELIDRRIVPDLAAARERLDSLDRVPEEQRPLVAAAEEYLLLRADSWRLRSEALRKRRMALLREADAKETASLAAFQRIG